MPRRTAATFMTLCAAEVLLGWWGCCRRALWDDDGFWSAVRGVGCWCVAGVFVIHDDDDVPTLNSAATVAAHVVVCFVSAAFCCHSLCSAIACGKAESSERGNNNLKQSFWC